MHDQIAEQTTEISRLLDENGRLGGENTSLQNRYFEIRRKYEAERQEKEALRTELTYLRNGARSTGTDAVPLPPRRHQQQSRAQHTGASASELESLGCGNCTSASACACVEATMSIAVSGCGNCTPDSHCKCLEETLKAPTSDGSLQLDLKRSHALSQGSMDAKRPRLSIEYASPTEIDFTAQFATKTDHIQERLFEDHTSLSRPAGESCGFCAEGTFCACAEAAAASLTAGESSQDNRLAPLLSEVTPPPSENDVTSAETSNYKLPSLHPNHRMHHAVQAAGSVPVLPTLSMSTGKPATPVTNSCANGPGSCKQCQEDPKSGLFCRSLAAMRASSNSIEEFPSGCCGGASSGGGCCKDQGKTLVSLSVADTYKTLASHKNFEQATDDLGNWMPKLQTSSGRYPGRAPLDIEAASVMNVIKYFDVRFGRN
jgi:hypothetical protein